MEGWHTVKLGDVCSLENGDRGKNYPSKSAYVSAGVPFVNAGHLTDGGVNLEGMNYIPEERYSLLGGGKFSPGDILFCLRGSLGKFGVVGVEVGQGAIASSLVIVRPKLVHNTANIVSRDFLAYYFRSAHCANMIARFAGGAAQPNLGARDLSRFTIPLPLLPEQERIVAILDEAFAAIATATANAEKNLANARALFKSELNRVFSQKGDGWVERRLGDLGEVQTGSTPRTSEKENFGDFIPFIKPADFRKNGSLNFNNEALSEAGIGGSRLISGGSVLMVCIGATIGKAGVADRDITANQQINALTPRGYAAPKYLYYQMLTSSFQSEVLTNSGQATLPIINKTKWSNLGLWLPQTIQEQEHIVLFLDHLFEQTLRLETICHQKVTALTKLKQSLLQKAFNGELTANPKIAERALSEAGV